MDAPNLSVVVQQTVGPILIGVVIHALLLGVVGWQYVQYFASDFKDSKKLKFTVAWMALLDLLLMMNSAACLWYYAVESFANPSVLKNTVWHFTMLPIFCTLSAFPVQVFLADRIRKFSGSSLLFYALVLLSLAGVAQAWVTAIKFEMDSDVSHRATLLKFSYTWNGISLGCDTILTYESSLSKLALMTYFLWQKSTAFERTNKILNHYMQVGIQSALPVTLCSDCQAIILILSRTLTTTNIHYIFSVNLGRLYSIILLTTLNMRLHMREVYESSSALNTIDTLDLKFINQRSRYAGKEVTISITHTQETHVDSDIRDEGWSGGDNDNRRKSRSMSV